MLSATVDTSLTGKWWSTDAGSSATTYSRRWWFRATADAADLELALTGATAHFSGTSNAYRSSTTSGALGRVVPRSPEASPSIPAAWKPLQKMLAYARPGDTIVVHTLDRLGRNLRRRSP